jgi:hypothetical protein
MIMKSPLIWQNAEPVALRRNAVRAAQFLSRGALRASFAALRYYQGRVLRYGRAARSSISFGAAAPFEQIVIG